MNISVYRTSGYCARASWRWRFLSEKSCRIDICDDNGDIISYAHVRKDLKFGWVWVSWSNNEEYSEGKDFKDYEEAWRFMWRKATGLK